MTQRTCSRCGVELHIDAYLKVTHGTARYLKTCPKCRSEKKVRRTDTVKKKQDEAFIHARPSKEWMALNRLWRPIKGLYSKASSCIIGAGSHVP